MRKQIAERCLIVAEAGTSHNGNIGTAERMIAEAKKAGADIIKFQYVIADEIVHPASGSIKLPGGMIPVYKQFKALECKPDFYADLAELCNTYNIEFLCTPFGLESARQLHKLAPERVKIASPELNHIPLLKEVDSWDIPVVLSSGVSRDTDIQKAVHLVKNSSTLLHCVTSYPAPEEDYNLNVLPKLRQLSGIPVGVSDHSLHPWLVPALAAAKGAVMIEKHFTLSRKGSGLDDPIALPPSDFALLTRKVREAENNLPEECISEYKREFGASKIMQILGSGKKDLAPSEFENYYTTRRSVLAVRDIRAGEIAGYSNCGIYRSEKNLIPGMEPENFEIFIGKTITKDIPAGGPVLTNCF